MSSKKKEPNPWNKNPLPAKSKNVKKEQKGPTASEIKFNEAHVKLQAGIQKHMKDYESSSEEEEIESSTLIGEIVKKYAETGAGDDYLHKTRTYLQQSFHSGAPTCLICISRIKRENSIWSCKECHCEFHLTCIQRWSKDTIVAQKRAIEAPIQIKPITLTWGCPKCRHDYQQSDIPSAYLCYCQSTADPPAQPFLAPHSCGELCRKALRPACGHQCLLLCHPGPCPPCPVVVSTPCHCLAQPPSPQRCSEKHWSCGAACGRALPCGRHACAAVCHAGGCAPCGKKSLQRCRCEGEVRLRNCADAGWQCEKACGRAFACGFHRCRAVCHAGACGDCPLTGERTCPCGKSKFRGACTVESPTCVDTCDKLLECGAHRCGKKCHKGECGNCLETVTKVCRCGSHSKEIHCYKEYFCERKCKRMKDCNKHPCNRKCCDGSCSPCEKPCARSLNCGTGHKCSSVCHRGLCYPCTSTDTVSCRCGETKIVVPCGKKHRTKPPKCNNLCMAPPDCHHAKREPHRCHYGECPPCRQKCLKAHPDCAHSCPASCHASVSVKIASEKIGPMPWDVTKPQVEKRNLPCPACAVPMPVTCLGGHETAEWPCARAQPTSCGRKCGRVLSCTNHACTLICHLVENATDGVGAGTNCERCEAACSRPRPAGCAHPCPRPCHADACAPCRQPRRVRCHCGLHQPYVACAEWLRADQRERLQSCGGQCPRSYACGHRCRATCHSGPCPDAAACRRKVRVACACRRLRREFACEAVRAGTALLACDDSCALKREGELRELENVEAVRRLEEEERDKIELEKYQKMFEGKKAGRSRKRVHEEENKKGLLGRYWIGFGFGAVVLAAVVFFVVKM